MKLAAKGFPCQIGKSRHGLYAMILSVAFLVGSLFGVAHAEQAEADLLPPASRVGKVHRDADGHIVIEETAEDVGKSPLAGAPKAPGSSDRANPAIRKPPRPPALPEIAPAASAPARGTRVHPPETCPTGSIACFAVYKLGDENQTAVPITTGEGFRKGALPSADDLVARDGKGNALPVQLDQTASHDDGSVRFGIVSVLLPSFRQNEPLLVGLFKREKVKGAPPTDRKPLTPDALLARGYDIRIELEIYSPEIRAIQFGDRVAMTPGIPFKAGERIAIEIGTTPSERFQLTVTDKLAGGGVTTLRSLAEAFVLIINEQSKRFRAYKTAEAYGDEKIWISPQAGHDEPLNIKFDYAGEAHLTNHLVQQREDRRRYVASARAALEALSHSPSAAPARTWLAGPVATEFLLEVPFSTPDGRDINPHLQARFSVRGFSGNTAIRSDVAIENDWAYEAKPRNWTYDVTIRSGADSAYQKLGLVHNHHARWHKVVWTGPAPEAAVAMNLRSFIEAGILPPYDINLAIPEAVIAEQARQLAAAKTEPMGSAFVLPYMPTTGGRSDLGFLPRWGALHLLSMDPRAAEADRANGDAAGGVPIHFRDRATDEPVSLDDHPNVVMGNGQPNAKDAFPEVANGATDWTPDLSHQPSLAYSPYLTSGDLFYLDELSFWANFNLGYIDPNRRGDADGIIMEQVRGVAWAWRSLGQAVAVLPDHHKMKHYFAQKLTNNLVFYNRNHAQDTPMRLGSPLGAMESDQNSVAAWQNDFLFVVTGYLVGLDVPGAADFFKWLGHFTIGRWTNEAAGFCPAMAAPYYIKDRDAGDRWITSWKVLFEINWPDAKTCPAGMIAGDPDSPSGYVAYAAAALAVAVQHNFAGSQAGYAELRRRAPQLRAKWSLEPEWAIVPPQESRARAEPY